MISKTTKKLISFSDRNIEMLEAIAAQSGWQTPTEIVKRGIEELYFKYFPAYRTGQGNQTATTEEGIIKSAVIKAKAKVAAKNAEKDEKAAKKYEMCEQMLGGEVIENVNGYKFCKFTQYSFTGDHELEIPIMQVDPIVAETSLFLPSKESVFRERPEVKKKFNKLTYHKPNE
jgi:hypothetical protein